MYTSAALLLITLAFDAEGYVTYIAARLPLQGDRAEPGSPWPQPRNFTYTDRVRSLDPHSFTFTSNAENCDVLEEAFRRYQKLIFFDSEISKDQLVVTSVATISASSVWGALRGLETFSQLVYTEDGKYCINDTVISDSPRFRHRGVMVDTARHYIPVPILLKHLDAMSYNKFNVFHWHIVDDQSFPYVSTTFPELSREGAFSSKHVYTQEDVGRIIEYARMRGIRVIPEFDTPGHAQGWGRAFKYLLTTCWADGVPGRANYSDHAKYENLDPTQNATYDFLSQFFSEVKDVFKDEFLHMGQDEAHPMCWRSNPNISDFMAQRGFKPEEYYKLEQYFRDRLLRIISGMGRRNLVWQDPIDNGGKVPPDSLIHVWKDVEMYYIFDEWRNYMNHVTAEGYDVIFSSCWYLNYISYGEDWVKYYQCEPLDFNGTDTQKEKVQGGEACMWTEYVDGTNLLPRYWPRASAVAERLWSPASVKDTDTARFRLDQQRCRMVRRGIPAEPILPGYCGDYDYGFLMEPEKETHTCTGSSAVAMLNVFFLFISVAFNLL